MNLNRAHGHTIIVIEHSLEAVVPYATRLVLMEKGKVLCDGELKTGLKYMYEQDVCKSAVPPYSPANWNLKKPASIRRIPGYRPSRLLPI